MGTGGEKIRKKSVQNGNEKSYKHIGAVALALRR